jgi:CheY-like chemotaxis protein
VAHDGVEAMLAIQRALPRAVVLDAALPKMYGFQVCEIVKRNESLRETRVVLVGAIHKEERYRRAPRDLYGADVYVEPPDLPDALLEILTRFGLPVRSDAAPGPKRAQAPYGHIARGTAMRDSRTEPLLGDAPAAGAVHDVTREAPPEVTREASTRSSAQGGRPASGAAAGGGARSEPKASEAHQDAGVSRHGRRNDGLEGHRSAASAPAPTPAPRPLTQPAPAKPAAASDPLSAERAKAERLARIIVSDIVLYNPEKFAAAARSGGDVAAAMRDELEEGRALFRERIDAQVRGERDHLAEELNRAAKARSGR